MQSVSIDKVISFDLHTIKIPEVFSIPMLHLSALPLFAREIQKQGWGDWILSLSRLTWVV